MEHERPIQDTTAQGSQLQEVVLTEGTIIELPIAAVGAAQSETPVPSRVNVKLVMSPAILSLQEQYGSDATTDTE